MRTIDWCNAAERAFNFYFSAVKKEEEYDQAEAWFHEEISEQVAAAGLEYIDGWDLEISSQSMQLVVDTLANQMKSLNDLQGYPVSAEFYGAFHSFFENILYNRAQTDAENFGPLLSYWNETLWNELPVS